MKRVAILCPSRDRPKDLADLLRSVIQTAPDTQLLAYIDRDQRQLYQWCFDQRTPEQLSVTLGERLGPCAAANHLLRKNPGFEAYGFFCDDCRVTVAGWDSCVLKRLGENGVHAVAPAHSVYEVDFPFLSSEWVEALGWYCHPSLYHWGWNSLLAALGEATQSMVQASPGEFWYDHDMVHQMNRDKYPQDIVRLYEYFANHFGHDLRRLREVF